MSEPPPPADQVFICDDGWLAIKQRLRASPQQIEIAKLIISGDKSAQAIGLALKLKPSTVEEQLERLYERIRRGDGGDPVNSRAALVNRIWREYLWWRHNV